jgi:hypothetical protein
MLGPGENWLLLVLAALLLVVGCCADRGSTNWVKSASEAGRAAARCSAGEGAAVLMSAALTLPAAAVLAWMACRVVSTSLDVLAARPEGMVSCACRTWACGEKQARVTSLHRTQGGQTCMCRVC